ncbi:MAG: hypothetical protein R3247_07580, partial [Rhodothermales bacterium]|nr:hypothetical protein [Rhodothermales bacterium]
MRATTPPVLMLLFFLLACGGVEATEPEAPGVVPGKDVIATRVAEAEERLRGHGEAGQRALAAIAAHGGLPRWYANGP